MADYNLGTARGRIELDASGAVTGAATANAAMDSVDGKARSAGAGAAVLGGALVGVGAVAVGAFGLAVRAAANFEEQLSGIKAVSGATESQMENLRKKALQLGADTAFSAGDAALAMEELAKAGLSVDDILNGAADATVNLAAAGGIDLPQAATIASNAMNQFGLSAEQLPHVADLIAGSANASAIDVADFGMSLTQAGATANLVGLSFDDLALAITAMGNAGIKGSDAGTSLKTFLSNLQPDTERQTELFKELGLTQESLITSANTMGNAFFDAQGKIRPMAEISDVLRTALTGQSEAQQAATLQALFGSDAIRAAAIIAGEGSVGFNELAASMAEVGAADVAATRLDNFNGSIEQLKGSFETFLITAGTPFLDFLRGIVDHLTKAVNWLSQLDEETLKYITAGVAIGGIIALISGSVLLLTQALGPAADAIKLLGAAFRILSAALLTNPFILLAAAIVAAGVAIYYLYTHNEGFRAWIDNVVDKIVAFGEAVQKWFNDVALPAIQKFWDVVGPILASIGEVISTVFTGVVVPAIQSFVSFLTDTLVPGVAGAFSAVQGAIQPTIDWIKENVFATFFEVGNAIFVAVLRIIDVIQIMAPFFEAVFSIIINIVQTAMSIIGTVIGIAVGFLTGIWNLFGDNLVAAFQLAWNLIKNIVETVLGVIRGIAQIFIGIFTGDMDKFLEGVRTLWDTIWNAIKNTLQNIWDAIKLVVQTAVDAIHLAIDTGLNVIKGIIETAWNIIKLAFSTAWDTIKSTVSTGIDAVKGFIDGLKTAISATFTAIHTAIVNIWNTLWDRVQSIISIAIDAVSAIFNGLESAWRTVWNGIKSAITGPINAVVSVIDKISSAIRTAIGWIGDLISKINSIPTPGDVLGGLRDAIPFLAAGGIIHRETIARVAESGAEAVIPLTNASRAMDLMDASGLTQMVLGRYGGASGSSGQSSQASSGGDTYGPGISIDTVNVHDGVDWDILMMQAEAQYGARSFA